jgi:hypothetical protein
MKKFSFKSNHPISFILMMIEYSTNTLENMKRIKIITLRHDNHYDWLDLVCVNEQTIIHENQSIMLFHNDDQKLELIVNVNDLWSSYRNMTTCIDNDYHFVIMLICLTRLSRKIKNSSSNYDFLWTSLHEKKLIIEVYHNFMEEFHKPSPEQDLWCHSRMNVRKSFQIFVQEILSCYVPSTHVAASSFSHLLVKYNHTESLSLSCTLS